jgi:serine phosphatase RsbU (regulator of sigma subunit)
MHPERSSGDTRQVDEVERVNRLYAVLSRVNEAIVRIHEPQELFEEACRIAVEDGQFVLAWIGFVDPETQFIRRVAECGRDDGYLDTVRISLDKDVPEGRGPTGVALREGLPFVNNDTENSPLMRPWRDEQLKRGFRSSASFPLKTEGRTIGAITLYAGKAHYFDDEEVRLLTSLADDFSFALESAEIARQRAQAVEALRNSHDELEARVADRTAKLETLYEERSKQADYAEALNRINESVHSTLDFDEIMNRVVVEITDALGVDATVVQVHREGHWEFAFEHGLPEGLRSARPPDADVPFSMTVLETRRPLVVNDVRRDERANSSIMQQFGITALMAVPLIVRGEVFGVLLADRFGVPEPFVEQQLDFLQKAAATLALALDNARLYETERTIADRLQEALLTLPGRLPGVEFAYAYHSATETTRVGGDFYDIFELDQDRVGITIGDVAGKGLGAAALTSLAKNTIRAYAMEKGRTTSQVFALTNDVMFRATPAESFTTVLFGILDCRSGRLTYCNAGHPTGAVVRADGTVGRLRATGPLLGAFADAEYEEAEVPAGNGDFLFLCTDGLTDARQDREIYGEERLFEFLKTTRGRAMNEVVEEVVLDVMCFAQNRLRDDLAILAVRRVAPGPDTPAQEKPPD